MAWENDIIPWSVEISWISACFHIFTTNIFFLVLFHNLIERFVTVISIHFSFTNSIIEFIVVDKKSQVWEPVSICCFFSLFLKKKNIFCFFPLNLNVATVIYSKFSINSYPRGEEKLFSMAQFSSLHKISNIYVSTYHNVIQVCSLFRNRIECFGLSFLDESFYCFHFRVFTLFLR